AALASHLNTISNFLLKKTVKHQVLFDEFYDFCYRTDWITTRQPDLITKNIIRSRLSDIYKKTKKIIKPDNVRDNFNNRFAEYANSYPDLDLTV
ncbi:glycosyltransferase family 2 protein, partial [Escherichia coli]|nr:glycosyltransferase family 2 protein [Escherichia coli]